jgi:hypothetical protein
MILFAPLVIVFLIIVIFFPFYVLWSSLSQGQFDPETIEILPFWPVGLILAAGVALGFYLRLRNALNLIPGREALEIDERSLAITRFIPFRHTRRIRADEILGICHSGLFLRGPLAGSTALASLFSNGLWVWRTGRFGFIPITICNGLHSVRANTVLAAIHERYPQYHQVNQ